MSTCENFINFFFPENLKLQFSLPFRALYAYSHFIIGLQCNGGTDYKLYSQELLTVLFALKGRLIS